LSELALDRAVSHVGEDGQWKRLMYHCAVPETMVVDGEVKGLRASIYQQPTWALLAELDGQTGAAVRIAVQSEPVLTLEMRTGAAATLKVRARALI